MVYKFKHSIAIFIYLPHCVSAFSSFHPSKEGVMTRYPCITFLLLTYFPLFKLLQPLPKLTIKKEQLDPSSCGKRKHHHKLLSLPSSHYTFWLPPSPHSLLLLTSESLKLAGAAAVGWSFP